MANKDAPKNERTVYIKDDMDRFIPRHLLSNAQELEAYLRGYVGTDIPTHYRSNKRLMILYNFGNAVRGEAKNLVTTDGINFRGRPLRRPQPFSEKMAGSEAPFALDSLTSYMENRNISDVPAWAFEYPAREGDNE